MDINGLTIPDAGTTNQVIIDAIGGWAYTITTTIEVSQQNLNDYKASFQEQINQAQATIVSAQAQVDELTKSQADFSTQVAAAQSTQTATLAQDQVVQ